MGGGGVNWVNHFFFRKIVDMYAFVSVCVCIRMANVKKTCFLYRPTKSGQSSDTEVSIFNTVFKKSGSKERCQTAGSDGNSIGTDK